MTRRAFQSLKNRIGGRLFLAGKTADTPSSAEGPATVHDAAIHVVEAMKAHRGPVDQGQIETDIWMLARDPSGCQHIQQALTSYGDEDTKIMVEALLHRVAADLTCEAEVIWHRFCIWSICCWAIGCAGAAAILAVIGPDPTWRAIVLVCTAAAFVGLELTATGLAMVQRRSKLAKAAAVRGLLAAC